MIRLIFCLLSLFVIVINCDQYSNDYADGNRSVIVQLFEWRFDDIGDECENFLGPYGYAGVQVSPVLEYAIIDNNDAKRPWYERYQPVSYKLSSRSGDLNDFRKMVDRCNKAKVRIYIDLVINHMAAGWSGKGTNQTPFNGNNLDFPGVPYNRSHFHVKEQCPTKSGGIEDWCDPTQVRNCELVGLRDLNHHNQYVRQKIADAINMLNQFGVAGYRVDASKHMWPNDLKAILDLADNLNTTYFPPNSKPFVYHEMSDLGGCPNLKASEYIDIGKVLEFKYRNNLIKVIKKQNAVLKSLSNFGQSWGMLPDNEAVVFVDNHDTQRENQHGTITFRESRLHKIATAFMLAWPYGQPKVMSSYYWEQNLDSNGHDKNFASSPPQDEQLKIKHVIKNNDLTCGNGWVCEHRWRQIHNMVKFRNIAGQSKVTKWWDNGYQQIAFARGNRAFIVINNEDFALKKWLDTNLPQGTYCDVISGNKINNQCTGRSLNVNNEGWAEIEVNNQWEDPMVAIHIDSKLS